MKTHPGAKTAAPLAPPVPRLSEKEFRMFRDFLHREAGIHLSDAKKALVVARLSRRLRELGLTSFSDYFQRICDGDDSERTRMLDNLCTNETHFFRDPRQFAFLENELVPGWIREAAEGRRGRQIRVWSAGCSTGEEPYSLAMLLLHALPPASGWGIEILATDISSRVLAAARSGLWRAEQAAEIPERFLKRFMLRGIGLKKGLIKAGAEIRSLVRFAPFNLVRDDPSSAGAFDLIFCRNVMIYFDWETKRKVVNRLLDRLLPGGHLFLGHAESLSGLTERARSAGPTAYRRTEEAPRSTASRTLHSHGSR